MRIGFVSRWNLADPEIRRRAFSGIIWHVLKEFEAQGDRVEYIGPVQQNLIAKSVNTGIKVLNRLKVFTPHVYGKYHPVILEQMARQAEQLVADRKIDVLLAQDSTVMAYFPPSIPLVYWRDANFADIQDAYKVYSNLHPLSVEWAHKHERKAMNRADLNIFSSECSYKTATSTYGIPSAKVAVVPFGANHDFVVSSEDTERYITGRSRDLCRLLFIGIEWERKGGDTAIEICRILNQRGIPTTLDIIGSDFAVDPAISHKVRIHGRVDKFTSEGSTKLQHLLEQSHFLVHPARAEAYGCVLCEACSFGIPCVTSSVGGIPTIIKNGKNGVSFPASTPASTYATYIEETFRNFDLYIRLAKATRSEYQERLNWQVAVAKARELITEMLERKQDLSTPSEKVELCTDNTLIMPGVGYKITRN
jgi:glycosyltransferase involved in cell wall biosynthesis